MPFRTFTAGNFTEDENDAEGDVNDGEVADSFAGREAATIFCAREKGKEQTTAAGTRRYTKLFLSKTIIT